MRAAARGRPSPRPSSSRPRAGRQRRRRRSAPRGRARDVDPAMDVRRAVVVPGEGRAFVEPAVGGVPEEDRAAERRPPLAMAVGAEGRMTPREHPLERPVGPRLAEDRDVIALEPTVIVVHLPGEPLEALLAAEALED